MPTQEHTVIADHNVHCSDNRHSDICESLRAFPKNLHCVKMLTSPDCTVYNNLSSKEIPTLQAKRSGAQTHLEYILVAILLENDLNI